MTFIRRHPLKFLNKIISFPDFSSLAWIAICVWQITAWGRFKQIDALPAANVDSPRQTMLLRHFVALSIGKIIIGSTSCALPSGANSSFDTEDQTSTARRHINLG